MICASRSGSSTCTGDDGGPVVTVSSKQLVGVMSSSSVLCFPGLDNTFTSVASVNDWITKTIKWRKGKYLSAYSNNIILRNIVIISVFDSLVMLIRYILLKLNMFKDKYWRFFL